MTLWLRRAVVDVGPVGSSDGLRVDSRGDGTVGEEQGLRVAFDVTKTIQSDSNKATVQVYGLGQSRERVQRGHSLRLRLAYGQDALDLVYDGEVTRVETTRSGAELITAIECGDGVSEFRGSTVEKTFREGTSVGDVIKKVAESLTIAPPDRETEVVSFAPSASTPKKPPRVSVRRLKADLETLNLSLKAQGFATVLRQPLSVSGNAREVMDALSRMWRFDWSVQDGVLQVVAYGATLVGSALVLSAATGLLGIPVVTQSGVKLTSLILPGLLPGAALKVTADTVNGQYRAEKVHLQGDTRGESWSAETEARSL